MSDNQPDIILFVNEQHRGDCLGCEGHPVLITPTMDQIAACGTRLACAYSACPVCVPARATLLNGQEPGSHGIVGFGLRDWQAPTLPQMLLTANYQTAWIGRGMHQLDPEQRYGFETVIASDHRCNNDAYDRFLARNQPENGGGYYGSGVMHNDWTARPFHLPEQLHHTNWVIGETLRWLDRRDRERPYFLVVSFLSAHPPLVPPACYFDRYIRTGVPSPVYGDWAEEPGPGAAAAGPSATHVHLQGEALLSARAGYYGLINHLDDQLNRVLNNVTGIDLQSDRQTVVMMTADHGEMLGDHYRWRKSLPYEGAARVPLLIRGPAQLGWQRGAICDAPVGLQDIMPTCLDLAGVNIPASVDGRSLVPLLRGATPAWRRHLHLEHAPGWHALCDGRHKYVWWNSDGREQLFDLECDPQELHDCTAEQPEELARWRTEMVCELADRPEGFSDGRRLLPGRPYHALIETSPAAEKAS